MTLYAASWAIAIACGVGIVGIAAGKVLRRSRRLHELDWDRAARLDDDLRKRGLL